MARTTIPYKMASQQGFSGKHFTKKELEQRKNEEVALSNNAVVPSEFLPEKFHKRFHWFVEEFSDFGILTNVDSDTLSRYIMADYFYWEATKILVNMSILDEEYPMIQAIQDKYFKQVNALAKEMGLTMVSRSKLKREAPPIEQDSPTTAQQLFSIEGVS